MIRKCDGTDPYTTKRIPVKQDGARWKWTAYTGTRLIPCNCGRRFDDIKYSKEYPHNAVGGTHYGTSFTRRANEAW